MTTPQPIPSEDEFTPEVLEKIIAAAIKAHDFEAVDAALRLLAVRAPHRAQTVLDTINVGLAIADRRPR